MVYLPRPGQKSTGNEGHATKSWIDWLTSLTGSVQASASRVATISYTDQSGSIGATDISNGTLPEGLYLFMYSVRITAVNPSPSDIVVVLDWNDAGAAVSFTSATLSSTSVTVAMSDVELIHISGGTPVRYSTTFLPGTASCRYRVDFVLLRLT